MSAVSINPSQALPAAPPAKRYRSIRVTRGHVVAVLLATLVTSVLDFAFLFDKLGKPGIWKIFAFEPIVSLSIFSSALVAWLVVTAQPSERTRWGRLVAASVFSAALTAAVTMPHCGCSRHRAGVAGDDGKDKADATLLAAVHRQHGAAFAFCVPVHRWGSKHASALGHAASGAVSATRAGHDRTRGAGSASDSDAGAGRASVPV